MPKTLALVMDSELGTAYRPSGRVLWKLRDLRAEKLPYDDIIAAPPLPDDDILPEKPSMERAKRKPVWQDINLDRLM